MSRRAIKVYSDYKSPYAYLAKDLVYDLERETGAQIEWLPYTLDIPAYLGHARVDAAGTVLEESRNAHQWRRVKYSYMDCRREANRRGLTIKGPRRIFDSSLANIGMLYAKRHGVFRAYHDRVFARFWQRELDLESPAALAAVLQECGAPSQECGAPSQECGAPSQECGAPSAEFASFLHGQGRHELTQLRQAAEAAGVFGVPSFLFPDGDLYWGREHLPQVRERLLATP
jgi:2-hydroxychromene-2-carboxylate isomerase